MRILILGGTGFIENAIFHSLVNRREYEIVIGSRSCIEGFNDWKKVDFSRPNDFKVILKDVDLVINAIGIIEGDFEKVQTESPLKLFRICKQNGIKIINISAIGAEKKQPVTKFLQSKKIVDDFILSETDGKVIYPGIVLGERAKSSQFFKELSTLPLIPLLDDKPIPFVYITQLIALVEQVVGNYKDFPSRIFAVSEPQSMREILSSLHKGKSRFIPIPPAALRIVFNLFPKFNVGIFNQSMFVLFTKINANEYKPIFDKATNYIIGKKIKPSHNLLKILVIFSIAFIWIWSGIVSLFSWNKSLQLIAGIGVTSQYAGWFIYAGSIADILLGIGTLFKNGRKRVLLLQLLLIFVYTLIISVLAPLYWADPFGPLSKNIPLLALIFLTYKWEKSYWL